MSGLDSLKTGKKGGRPRKVSPEDQVELTRLYYSLNWTAKQIQAIPKFAELSMSAIRAIAYRERARVMESEGPSTEGGW